MFTVSHYPRHQPIAPSGMHVCMTSRAACPEDGVGGGKAIAGTRVGRARLRRGGAGRPLPGAGARRAGGAVGGG